MKNQSISARPAKIKLVGTLDLDLTKRGIREGEDFIVDGFDEKTQACYVKDSRVDGKYPFVVWKENYKITEYLKNPAVLYETEEERSLRERLEGLDVKLHEIQGKIERTCPKCNPYGFRSLSSLRQELRKEIVEVNKLINHLSGN